MLSVSVIIPTHNRAELLSTAISSVLEQTFRDFEIIIVDDHSTDNTSRFVASFKDKRVRYIQNEGKNGPSTSRNLGITKAKGRFIAFLDDDDEWIQHKLEKQIELLESGPLNICGVYSNRLMINKKNGKAYSEDPGVDTLRGNLLEQLMIKNPIHTSTLMVKKSCLDEIGYFDETMRFMEDRDLWIRLSTKWDFEYIDEPLVKAYRHGNEHLSSNLMGQTHGREIMLHRYRSLFKKNRKAWSEMFVCLGTQYCQLNNMEAGRKNLLKGIKIYPFRKLPYFHLLSSFLGARNYQRLRKRYISKNII